jgi:hypothetical protein
LAQLGLSANAVTSFRGTPSWDLFAIVNGDFEAAGSSPTFNPGWSDHGGGGSGLLTGDAGNHPLQLDGHRPVRTHNWLVLPPGAGQIGFDLRRVLDGPGDRLRVRLGDRTIWEQPTDARDLPPAA